MESDEGERRAVGGVAEQMRFSPVCRVGYVERLHRDIRFTNSEDGVSIAFWAIGEGKPLLLLHNLGLSHAELEWNVPSMSSLYSELAKRYRLIRFDPRGSGLSGNPPNLGATTPSGVQVGMSSHEMCLDVEAVLAECSLSSVALMAISVLGPIGIEFTAKHPEMVTELILYDSMADIASSHIVPLIKAEKAVLEVQREIGQRLPYKAWEENAGPEDAGKVADIFQTNAARVTTAPVHFQLEWNAESLLGQLTTPVLIMCSRRNPQFGDGLLTDSRRLAAGISDSQLRVIDGTFTPYFADQEQVLNAIDGFLKPEDTPERLSGFRTVVFTDIVDSTKFMARVGDHEGREAMRTVEQLVSELADQHGGRVIKNLGDGSLVSFSSNTAALRFAIELQSQTDPDSLQLRVGMAAGEPIEEGGDIHGAVVAYASRVADIGDAGEIIASDSVRQLAMGKGFTFTPMGEHDLKGFEEPATVWTVTASDNE